MRKKSFVFLFLAAAVVELLLPAAGGSSDYIIGPKDVLEIQVYKQPDLQQVVRVSEEGRITLSLIGDVRAAGCTSDELTKELTRMYKEFIYHPQVSVFIKEYYPKDIYVLGEVKKPGLFKITGNPTLLDLLSQSGGVSEGGGDTLAIIRKLAKDQDAQTISISLSELLVEGNRELNVEIMDGDTIYLPKADFFFVFGEVQKPGSYKLDKDMKINVLKAITLAGGFTRKAAKGKVKITRGEDLQTTIKADLNTEVMPQDIIIVPESFF